VGVTLGMASLVVFALVLRVEVVWGQEVNILLIHHSLILLAHSCILPHIEAGLALVQGGVVKGTTGGTPLARKETDEVTDRRRSGAVTWVLGLAACK